MAAFTAARAAILHKTGETPKTHNGTHAEFARLCRDEPIFGPDQHQFLSRAYDFKQISDYEPKPSASPEQARDVIERAGQLLAKVEAFVRASDPAA